MSFTSHAPAIAPRLHRSKLFVPGSQPRFFAKAAAGDADAICLDLEDGVAPPDKETARDNIVRALHEIDWRGKLVTVRINGLDTAWCYRDVIALVERGGDALDGLMVPKVGVPADLYAIDMLAAQAGWAVGRTKPVMLEAQIESPLGLTNVAAIAGASSRLTSLHFGHADFAAAMGMRTVRIGGDHPDYVALGEADESGARAGFVNDPWHYPLVATIAAARARGILAFDGPYGEIRDMNGLAAYARRAAFLGCSGKWAIHPDQIGSINAAFSPPEREVAQARELLRMLAEAEASGRGAVSHDGTLIDGVTIRQARQLIALAEQGGQAET